MDVAINVRRLGLAVGLTFAMLPLGRVMVILFSSRETAVVFFNSLLHGIDVTGILRTEKFDHKARSMNM